MRNKCKKNYKFWMVFNNLLNHVIIKIKKFKTFDYIYKTKKNLQNLRITNELQ